MKKLVLIVSTILLLGAVYAMYAAESNQMQVNTEEEFNKQIKENHLVVLLVSATWCPPCQKLKPIIGELAGEMKNVKFVDIDDDTGELAAKYRADGYPTIKIYKDGKMVESMFGLKTKQFLQDLINKHIDVVVTKDLVQPVVLKEKVVTITEPVVKTTKVLPVEEVVIYEADDSLAADLEDLASQAEDIADDLEDLAKQAEDRADEAKDLAGEDEDLAGEDEDESGESTEDDSDNDDSDNDDE